MKKAVMTLALMAVATVVAADEGASVERGRKLFEDTKLGTTGKSCASCHPGGRKLEWAATFDEDKLGRIVNNCITGPLKGKALSEGSDDLKSLVQFIKSLAGR